MPIAVGAILAAVVVLVGVFFWNARQLVEANGWIEHTHAVRAELESAAWQLSSIESAGRGFALTGENAFLPPPHAGDDLRATIARIRRLTRDNPSQQKRLDSVDALVEEKLRFVDDLVATRRRSGLEAARALSVDGHGRDLMREARAGFTGMVDEEEALLRSRLHAAEDSARRTTGVGVALGVVLVSAVFAFLALVRHDTRERARVASIIRKSDERLRLLLSSVLDYAIYTIDRGGVVESWNEGARRIKGWEAGEVVGRHFSMFYPPEDRDKAAQELEIAARTGRYAEEGVRVRKDGSRFWANVVITPLTESDGTISGFAKVTKDVTERRREDDARKALLEKLARSNQELQDFAMIASHDLQEPLRKMQMFGDRLREQYAERLDDRGRDYLERMLKAAARGQTLIQGLLAYSRVTTKAQPAEAVDLGQLARDVVSDLEARIASVHGTVEIGALPTIEADPLQMRQLFQNLIGNALKFHREDAPPVVRVRASALPDGRHRLEFEDNGIGFDEKYVDRIFKLFQRLHERGTYEGAGMGLAICRKIVERHQGSIDAKSTPGRGTTFVVELPDRQSQMERAA